MIMNQNIFKMILMKWFLTLNTVVKMILNGEAKLKHYEEEYNKIIQIDEM